MHDLAFFLFDLLHHYIFELSYLSYRQGYRFLYLLFLDQDFFYLILFLTEFVLKRHLLIIHFFFEFLHVIDRYLY